LISDIALIVTAVGVLGAVYSLRQNYRQRLRQFEAMFVQRYWALLDKFSLDMLRGKAAEPLSMDEERAIRAYFFLCEDEMEMRAKEYIADSTYRIWRASILEQVKQPKFEEVLTQLRKEDAFPYEYLNLLLKSKELYDPCKMLLWKRWLLGLTGDGV